MRASTGSGSSYRVHRPSPLSTARPPSLSTSAAVVGETTASDGATISGRSIRCASSCQAIDTSAEPLVRRDGTSVRSSR